MSNHIQLTLIPESSFLLGGVTINPAYDSVTALDENNLPYLTATAIKGALRIEFEAFVRGIGQETLCDFDADIKGCKTCLSCRLFGGGNEEGKLRFNAAFIKDPDIVLPNAVRHDLLAKGKREGVSISRTLGKAKDKAYFTKLAFPNMNKIRKILFTTQINIRWELDGTEKEYLDMFFKYLGEAGLFMGSRKSVGLGYFAIDCHMPETFTPTETVDTSRKELKLYKITLETQEPLLVGNTKNKYIIDTLPYIPASTLGGTIGFRLGEHGIPKETLEAMFDVQNSFSTFNCYLKTPYPLPLSQRIEKGKPDPRKDILIPDYLIKLAIEQDKFAFVQTLFNALYKKNLRPDKVCKKPNTFYNAKLAIGRELQKAGDGLLYSMELIPKGCQFQGFMIGETWAVETLKKIGELCMGGKRTRGFGRTKISAIEEPTHTKWLKGNEEKSVDTLLKEMATEYSISLPQERTFFTLDLLSDFVFPEKDYTGPRTFKGFLEEHLFNGLEVQVEKAFVEIIQRGGYDFRKKHVKPMMEWIAAGSTFLVSVPQSHQDDFKKNIDNLVADSTQYKWDSTLLFRLDAPEHITIWR